MQQTNDFIVLLTTMPNSDSAKALASLIVHEKLAACVNLISNVKSVYRWQNKVEIEDEVQLFIKTTRIHLEKLEDFLKQQHPYDVPEMVVLNIESGNEQYLQWLKDSTL